MALLGGALALDGTSVGQFMVSRPLVAGALAGWLLGDPATGLTIGAALEMYLLVSFPTGGARFPEGATATVVAVAAATAADTPGALPMAIGVGLVWGQLGGLSITALRKVNGWLVPESSHLHHSPGRIVAVHLSAIALDFVRGCLVTLLGVFAGRRLVGALAEGWPLSEPASWALILVGASVSAGILLNDWGGLRRRAVVFGTGIGLGVLGVTLL